MSALFDAARTAARAEAAFLHTVTKLEVTIMRDVLGMVRLFVDDRTAPVLPETLHAAHERLRQSAGVYAPEDASVLSAKELFRPDKLWEGRHRVAEGVYELERTALAWDWDTPAEQERTSSRLVFYGVKGGVGRSTAAATLAIDLVRKGHRVLVVDLDLESPGVGATLLGAQGPRYGLVDWFVEDLVGQGTEELLRECVTEAPHTLSADPKTAESKGQLWVAPAVGAEEGDFIGKLARVYQPRSTEEGVVPFARRVEELVAKLEALTRATVTLVDSRAGLHEIAAAALLRLGGTALLFGIDTDQTWRGYELLFRHWRDNIDRSRALRERLQMVAGMVPENGREAYLESFREHAYNLFGEHLYDASPADTDGDGSGAGFNDGGDGSGVGFNFNLRDEHAPHTPYIVYWSRLLLEYQPRSGKSRAEDVAAAFGDFLARARALVGEPPES